MPTDNEIIADLRRVADELDKSPTITEYREHGKYSPSLVQQTFGSWNSGKQEAGLKTFNNGAKTGTRHSCYHCDRVFISGSSSATINCTHCDTSLSNVRSRIRYFKNVAIVSELARRPSANVDLPDANTHARQIIRKIKPPRRGTGQRAKTRSGDRKPVYYLSGDERQAMRVFIEENEEYIRDCLQDTTNPFVTQWSTQMYELLWEQWYWMGYDD